MSEDSEQIVPVQTTTGTSNGLAPWSRSLSQGGLAMVPVRARPSLRDHPTSLPTMDRQYDRRVDDRDRDADMFQGNLPGPLPV